MPLFISVIVNFHSERWLPRCVKTLYTGGDSEICIIVDNDRIDARVLDTLRQLHPRLEYIPCSENVGFGRANNIGIRHALEKGADLIGIINPDVWFESGWLQPVISSLHADKEYGMLAPLQLQYEGDALSEWAQIIVGRERVRAWGTGDPPIDVPWIEGSAMVIRSEVIRKIGLFDEIFDMYFEDNDLCRRARLAGYKIGVTPDSRYHHFGSGSIGGRGSLERNVRCDLSHLFYTMTNPTKGIVANSYTSTYMLMGLAWAWLKGSRSTFPHVAARFLKGFWRKREAILRKWKNEQALLTK